MTFKDDFLETIQKYGCMPYPTITASMQTTKELREDIERSKSMKSENEQLKSENTALKAQVDELMKRLDEAEKICNNSESGKEYSKYIDRQNRITRDALSYLG